ncbi:hypothetical protein HDU97_006138 [Phlyctochytrium planicorne]|nr:hypothetical protein HDU97_006138 [Phlyctochytrium planicorne]
MSFVFIEGVFAKDGSDGKPGTEPFFTDGCTGIVQGTNSCIVPNQSIANTLCSQHSDCGAYICWNKEADPQDKCYLFSRKGIVFPDGAKNSKGIYYQNAYVKIGVTATIKGTVTTVGVVPGQTPPPETQFVTVTTGPNPTPNSNGGGDGGNNGGGDSNGKPPVEQSPPMEATPIPTDVPTVSSVPSDSQATQTTTPSNLQSTSTSPSTPEQTSASGTQSAGSVNNPTNTSNPTDRVSQGTDRPSQAFIGTAIGIPVVMLAVFAGIIALMVMNRRRREREAKTLQDMKLSGFVASKSQFGIVGSDRGAYDREHSNGGSAYSESSAGSSYGGRNRNESFGTASSVSIPIPPNPASYPGRPISYNSSYGMTNPIQSADYHNYPHHHNNHLPPPAFETAPRRHGPTQTPEPKDSNMFSPPPPRSPQPSPIPLRPTPTRHNQPIQMEFEKDSKRQQPIPQHQQEPVIALGVGYGSHVVQPNHAARLKENTNRNTNASMSTTTDNLPPYMPPASLDAFPKGDVKETYRR